MSALRVLVVDDDPIAVELLAHLLAGQGYAVEVAADGDQALAVMLDPKRSCRIVLSDWNMPGLDGPQLCRAVRAAEIPGYVYFMLLTERGNTADLVAGFAAGADDYVAKPFEPEELLARLSVGVRVVGLETRDLLLFGMARLAESRDPDTGEHLERIRRYSEALAQRLAAAGPYAGSLDREAIRRIYLTSPLHDIGKIGLPDGVLLKPDFLRPDEFEIMTTHTLIGAATLDSVIEAFPDVEYLRTARNIALCHHERHDGTGYPHGLAGGAIPLEARIVALADSYDSLRSRRLHKPAVPHHQALASIRANAGQAFDPAVVEAFLAIADRFAEIAVLYGQPGP